MTFRSALHPDRQRASFWGGLALGAIRLLACDSDTPEASDATVQDAAVHKEKLGPPCFDGGVSKCPEGAGSCHSFRLVDPTLTEPRCAIDACDAVVCVKPQQCALNTNSPSDVICSSDAPSRPK